MCVCMHGSIEHIYVSILSCILEYIYICDYHKFIPLF